MKVSGFKTTFCITGVRVHFRIRVLGLADNTRDGRVLPESPMPSLQMLTEAYRTQVGRYVPSLELGHSIRRLLEVLGIDVPTANSVSARLVHSGASSGFCAEAEGHFYQAYKQAMGDGTQVPPHSFLNVYYLPHGTPL